MINDLTEIKKAVNETGSALIIDDGRGRMARRVLFCRETKKGVCVRIGGRARYVKAAKEESINGRKFWVFFV